MYAEARYIFGSVCTYAREGRGRKQRTAECEKEEQRDGCAGEDLKRPVTESGERGGAGKAELCTPLPPRSLVAIARFRIASFPWFDLEKNWEIGKSKDRGNAAVTLDCSSTKRQSHIAIRRAFEERESIGEMKEEEEESGREIR